MSKLARMFGSIGYVIDKIPPLKEFLKALNSESFRVIYYHFVSDKKRQYYPYDNGISTEDFVRQIEYFKQHYRIISLNDSISMLHRGESLQNCLAITTDDGFVENYTVIAPILKKYCLPATFFLTWNSIDNKQLIWCDKIMILINRFDESRINKFVDKLVDQEGLTRKMKKEDLMAWSARVFPMKEKERLSSLLWQFADIESEEEFLRKEQPYLSTIQINNLIKDGFEISAHSLSHPLFNKLSSIELYNEIFNSILLFESKFNIRINTFAYPFGIHPLKTEWDNILQMSNEKELVVLGTKNALNNFNGSLIWGRDKQENDYFLSIFYFFLLPIIRKIQLKISKRHN